MKKILISSFIGLLIGSLAVFLILHKTTPQKIESAEKNSFYEVTSNLNLGGNLYCYVSTEKAIQTIEQFVNKIRKILEMQVSDSQVGKLKPLAVFDFVYRMIKNSGLMEINGLGLSSIAIREDLYHSVFVLHHYADKGKGLIWNLMEAKPHFQNELKMLPSNTVLAGFTDFKVKSLWEWIKKEAETSRIPDVKQRIFSVEPLLKSQGIDFNKLLDSFSGRMGIALFLDKNKKTMLPIGNIQFEIPNPDFILVFSVKDANLFSVLQKVFPFAQKPEKKDEQKMFIQIPPLPIPLKPVIWQRNNLLFLASNESIVDSMFQTQKNGNGLTKTDEFKKLSEHIPEKGNSFRFISSKFFQLFLDIHQKNLKTRENLKKEEDQISKEFFDLIPKYLSFYGVSQNSDEGLIFTFNHNLNLEFFALMPATAMVGIAYAVAIPNMLTSIQKNKQKITMSNLEAIAGAIAMYAAKKGYVPQGNSLTEIRVQLEPDYIKQLPLKDAWGNDFIYASGKRRDEYYIGSGGRDRIFSGFEQNGLYSISHLMDFNNDIIIRNGKFAYSPELR